MNSREMLTISEGLQSPFWKYVKQLMQQDADEKRDVAVDIIPGTMEESNERERMFGGSKAIREFLTLVPNKIKDEMIRLQKLEEENTQQ